MTTVSTSDATFRLQEGETLLEGLERTGHDVEYQCRGGYCGTCRLKLEAGKVSYTTAPLAFVAPGEVLPCCCRPDGPSPSRAGYGRRTRSWISTCPASVLSRKYVLMTKFIHGCHG